jgi:predicted DNA-binding transcriptional regulator AlpA
LRAHGRSNEIDFRFHQQAAEREASAMRLLRYTDLVEIGVVNSRMTLKRLIDNQGFPPGRLITPNSRAWTDDEIDQWIAGRPTARKKENRERAA